MDNWNWDYPRFLGYTYENMQNDLGILQGYFRNICKYSLWESQQI